MNKFVSKLLPLFLLLFAAVPAFGQSKFGAITAASTDCSVANSCVSLLLNQAAGGATITLTGTWSATLNFEVSGDNGVTWAAASTASSTTIGVTNISVAGYTNLRVRCNPFTSGTVNVTIYSGTGSIRSGSSSSGATAAGPVMGFYLTNNCSSGNIGNCFSTFADTQQADACSWTNASTTVTCLGMSLLTSASVTTNVATYTSAVTFPSNWVAGNSVTITGYGGGDAFYNQTCTISTATTTVITCPLVHVNATAAQTTAQIVNNSVGPFVSSDVGKSAMGAATCATDQLSTAYVNPISASALLTINGFTSSTQVVLSGNPANTSTQAAAYPAGSCFIWGHPDDAGFASLWTAIASSQTCPKIFLAAAYYLVQSPPQVLWGNPYSCQQTGPGLNGGFGNTTLNAGMEVEGRGVIATQIFLAPSFPNGDTCAHLASSASTYTNNVVHAGGCFAMPLMGKWQDFALNGGYQTTGGLNSKTLITGTVATLQNFTCMNYGMAAAGNSIGIELSFDMNLYHVNSAGCGANGLWVDQNTNNSIGHRVIVENSTGSALILGNAAGSPSTVPGFVCSDYCDFVLADNQPLGAQPAVQVQGYLQMFSGQIGVGNGAQATTVANTFALQQNIAGAGVYLDGVFVNGGAGTNNGGISCTTACTTILQNSIVKAIGTGKPYSDVVGSNLWDMGRNTLAGGAASTVSGSVVNDFSIGGTPITAGALVLSAGWGTTAAWTALSGQTRLVQGTITASGTGQAANPTITYTFPTPFFAASNIVCSATQVGGTQTAVANPFTIGAPTATSVVFTYQGTPGAGNTLVVQINCAVR